MVRLKIKKRFLLVIAGLLISLHCFSQSDSGGVNTVYLHNMMAPAPPPPEEIFYHGSIEGGGGVTVPITNRALRLGLGGVYNLHFSGHYVLAPHFFAGLELEDVQLGNTTPNAVYNTLLSIYNVGAKFGYYTYMQQDFLFCYSLSTGPSLIVYSNLPPKAPPGLSTKEQSFFITPNMLASYRVNNELRIGVDISVVLLGYRFNAETNGIAYYLPGSYNANKDNNAITSCIEAGFGLYWAFAEAKNK